MKNLKQAVASIPGYETMADQEILNALLAENLTEPRSKPLTLTDLLTMFGRDTARPILQKIQIEAQTDVTLEPFLTKLKGQGVDFSDSDTAEIFSQLVEEGKLTVDEAALFNGLATKNVSRKEKFNLHPNLEIDDIIEWRYHKTIADAKAQAKAVVEASHAALKSGA